MAVEYSYEQRKLRGEVLDYLHCVFHVRAKDRVLILLVGDLVGEEVSVEAGQVGVGLLVVYMCRGAFGGWGLDDGGHCLAKEVED